MVWALRVWRFKVILFNTHGINKGSIGLIV